SQTPAAPTTRKGRLDVTSPKFGIPRKPRVSAKRWYAGSCGIGPTAARAATSTTSPAAQMTRKRCIRLTLDLDPPSASPHRPRSFKNGIARDADRQCRKLALRSLRAASPNRSSLEHHFVYLRGHE